MAKTLRNGEAWLLGFSVLVSYSTLAGVADRDPSFGIDSPIGLLILGRVFQAFVCLGIALAAARGRSPVQSRAARVVSAAVCSTAAALSLIADSTLGEAATVLAACGTMLRYGGYIFLWLGWMDLFSRLDLRHMLVDYLLVHVLSAGLSLVLGAIAQPTLMGVVVVMPWVAHFAWNRAQHVVAQAPYACGESEPHPWSFPLTPVILMAVFATVNLFVRTILLPGTTAIYATAGVVIACLAVLVAIRACGIGSFDIWKLGGVAFILSLTGLLGTHLNAPAWSVVASLCTNAGFAVFTVFLAAVLCNISYRRGVSSMVLFGFAKAADCLGYLVGTGLIVLAPTLSDDGFALLVAGLCIALALCFTLLVEGRGKDPAWGVGFDPQRPSSNPASTAEQRCAVISREAGLTRREEEVLNLLARDMSASEIEAALCVTNATVKTHTQAIYRKLGIHSRKEIVEHVGA